MQQSPAGGSGWVPVPHPIPAHLPLCPAPLVWFSALSPCLSSQAAVFPSPAHSHFPSYLPPAPTSVPVFLGLQPLLHSQPVVLPHSGPPEACLSHHALGPSPSPPQPGTSHDTPPRALPIYLGLWLPAASSSAFSPGPLACPCPLLPFWPGVPLPPCPLPPLP